MTSKRFDRVRTLFDQALELPANQRERFLAECCGQDPDLRKQIERLLSAGEEVTKEMLEESLTCLSSLTDDPDARSNWEGKHIGPYTIIREIGRGGMGSVYLAERSIGRTRQKLALKVLHPAWAAYGAVV